MTGFLEACITLSFWLLSLSLLIIVARIVIGPTLPDRILALDAMVAVAIGFIAVTAVATGYYLYIDIAIALGLVGFLATAAFAGLILRRGPGGTPSGDFESSDEVKAPTNMSQT